MTLKTINFRSKINLDLQQEREVKIMIILLSVFFSSIIFGISLTTYSKETMINVFNSLFNEADSFLTAFFNSSIINLTFVVIIFVSGFSCIGIPTVVLPVILKGLGIGSYCTYMVSEFGMSGIGIYLLTSFVPNIIFVVAFLFASDIGILQSVDILSLIYDKNQNKVLIRKYVYKNLFLIISVIIGSISEAFFKTVFGNLII